MRIRLACRCSYDRSSSRRRTSSSVAARQIWIAPSAPPETIVEAAQRQLTWFAHRRICQTDDWPSQLHVKSLVKWLPDNQLNHKLLWEKVFATNQERTAFVGSRRKLQQFHPCNTPRIPPFTSSRAGWVPDRCETPKQVPSVLPDRSDQPPRQRPVGRPRYFRCKSRAPAKPQQS